MPALGPFPPMDSDGFPVEADREPNLRRAAQRPSRHSYRFYIFTLRAPSLKEAWREVERIAAERAANKRGTMEPAPRRRIPSPNGLNGVQPRASVVTLRTNFDDS